MSRYVAAIFDLDGLLLDTERLAIAAGYETLVSLGVAPVQGLFESLVGRDDATAARMVAESLGGAFPHQDFSRRWGERFLSRLDEGIPLRPGAIELLDALAALGLPHAVATSSRRHSAEKKLALTGLAPRFGAVVTFDCVRAPKPAPDPYLLAAERLGADPLACIAFEDSDTGAAAARAAGMTVVQVPDMGQTDGRHAHHLASDLMTGARIAGLI
jgi:HAD superfamily hydrolase (TIGR01509 family)